MTRNGWHIGTALLLLFAMMAQPTETKYLNIRARETNWHRRRVISREPLKDASLVFQATTGPQPKQIVVRTRNKPFADNIFEETHGNHQSTDRRAQPG